jgi:uncharacterized protein (TIGR01777 family)
MIGTAIVGRLRERGDEVGALRRGGESTTGLDVAWDPAAGTIDADALEAGSFDAVVHLAGESLLGRWNDERKRRIRDSRVDGTRLLATSIAALERRPATFAVASATGSYGDRGEELLTEQSDPGTDFLAGVVRDWEAAADPARAAGIRTVHVRMAPVQGRAGGALKAQLLPFQLGAGGRVGSGRQWAPWIGLTEAASVWTHVLDTTELEGPINAVGPTPVRNREYVQALGRVLHRPTMIPAPIPLMKLALGSELIDEMLLTSQKVVPARLEGTGYEFLDRTIEDALRRELGRPA